MFQSVVRHDNSHAHSANSLKGPLNSSPSPLIIPGTIANPKPEAEEDEPETSAPWVSVEPVAAENSKADQDDHDDDDPALIRSSRDHGMRPLFMEKAATSQYSQNAAPQRRRPARPHAS